MSKYAEVSEVVKILTNNQTYSATVLQAIIDRIPEADVEPVRHGHWIRTGEYIAYKNLGQTKRMEEKVCSVCGAFAPYTKFGKQYCPPRCYCGAKMDEKEIER